MIRKTFWIVLGLFAFTAVGSADANFVGTSHLVVNCNRNEKYAGPCWGTFEWSIRRSVALGKAVVAGLDTYWSLVVAGRDRGWEDWTSFEQPRSLGDPSQGRAVLHEIAQ